MERRFEGDTTTNLKELMARARKISPEASDEEIEVAARQVRNFNVAHLRAYLKGKQIFHYGSDRFKRKIKHVVQAKLL